MSPSYAIRALSPVDHSVSDLILPGVAGLVRLSHTRQDWRSLTASPEDERHEGEQDDVERES